MPSLKLKFIYIITRHKKNDKRTQRNKLWLWENKARYKRQSVMYRTGLDRLYTKNGTVTLWNINIQPSSWWQTNPEGQVVEEIKSLIEKTKCWLPEALMNPQSDEWVFGIMEVWVSSQQTLKHLEKVGAGGAKDTEKISFRTFLTLFFSAYMQRSITILT